MLQAKPRRSIQAKPQQVLFEPSANLRVLQGQFDVGLQETFLAAAVLSLAFLAVGIHLLSTQQASNAIGQLNLVAHATRLLPDLFEHGRGEDVATSDTET